MWLLELSDCYSEVVVSYGLNCVFKSTKLCSQFLQKNWFTAPLLRFVVDSWCYPKMV